MVLEEKLAYLRKAKDLSQMELADMMGVSRQAVSGWETGASIPASGNLKRLSDLYDVSLDYLLDDDVDVPEKRNDFETTAEDEHDHVLPQKANYNKWIIGALIALCVIALISVICVCARNGDGKESVPINGLERESVEVEDASDSGFELEW